MDPFYRPTRAEISLDALRHNIMAFRKALPPAMKIMAVVKANAYGHGAEETAREAVDCGGADYLGVAFLDEAVELRNRGVTSPILVLGYTPPEGVAKAVRENIALTVYCDRVLEAVRSAVESEGTGPATIHIKIDTGMGRLGIPDEAEAIAFIEKARSCKGVRIEGLFTHYACADEADKSYTHEQYRRFERIVSHYRNQGVTFPYLHAGNSAAAIDSPELSYNMVRLGISLYGLYPSAEVNQTKVLLEPVMSFKTGVVMVKTLPPGTGISYGTIYHTQGTERIATLPVGYADGYTRMLTGRSEVLVRGVKAPIVGKICMDQCMINVTSVSGVEPGEEVVLFGRQGDAVIAADDLARMLGTINYEITCMVSSRVPRVYIRGGSIVKTVNHLLHG